MRFHALFLICFIILHAESRAQSDTLVAAGPEYSRSKFSRQLWGDHYREVWTTPVRVSLLDINKLGGGLTPVEMGGGRQTISLQFRGKDGNEYVARSINKNPGGVIPASLQGTIAEDIVKDQVSSAHPYGSLIVSGLADAVGIYHTEPELYYVGYHPELGEFADQFSDLLVTFEIRPDKDAVSLSRKYSDVDKSDKLFSKLSETSRNQVDQEDFVKNRLFDMLLGDWDRHADQYRWGEVEHGKSKIFYALPKDRDQVFTLFDGLIPRLASSKWAVRELEHYEKEFGDLKGLNLPARFIDRRLLVNLEKEDWINAAMYLQQNLTDEVITEAVKNLPPEIYAISGDELIQKLKSRRDLLQQVAEEYYLILAEKVDIPGSDDPETVRVERLPDGHTKVTVYNQEGKFIFFERLFKYGETDEIRIYTMGGNDSILITGEVDKGMKIRVLPGQGKDVVTDVSAVKGLFNKTKVYTHRGSGLQVNESRETKVIRVSSDTVFSYNDTMVNISYLGPVLSIEYNVDDGLFLGGGVVIKREGFRKEPFGSVQRITLNYATQFSSFNARYNGIFYSKLGKFWDIGLAGEFSGPRYIMNFFGLGNETDFTEKINYYRLRQNSAFILPSVIRRLGEHFSFTLGPQFNYTEVIGSPGRMFGDPEFIYASQVERPYWFGGGAFSTNLNTANDSLNPTSGYKWINSVITHKGFDSDWLFTNLGSEFSIYYRPVGKTFTFAHRIGGYHLLGDFPFFSANTLGGITNLRGYRRDRYAGRSAVFLNNEVRIRLGNFSTYLISGEIGLIGFADAGRVWVEDEISDKIHLGYGPGLYFNFLNLFLVSGTYGFSEDGGLINVNTGFLF